MKAGTIDVWAQFWYKPDKPALQAVADDLNVKVVQVLDEMWAGGWRPSWRWDRPALTVCILPGRREKTSAVVHVGSGHYDITLYVDNSTPTDTRLAWVLAHELAHCYFAPKEYPYNTAPWDLAHHQRPWEQVADEVASRVVDYTREESDRWALVDRQDCVTNSPGSRGG